MMGSFLTRGLIMALGYAYPAYECYKTVERNKPEIEQLRFWCQYWILVAVLTISERFGDAFISWLPMYCEAKLAFYVYLWYPRTRGTTYVYDTFFKPYVAKHEMEIDRSLLELRIRAGDMAVDYWRKAATSAQTRFFDILQFVASQSQPSRSRTVQRPPQPAQQVRQPAQPAVSARISAAQQQLASQQPKQPPPPPAKQQQPLKQPVSPSKTQAREPSKEPAAATVAASPAKSQPKEQPPKDVEVANPSAAVSPAPSRTMSAPASASSPTKAADTEPVNVEVTSRAPAVPGEEAPKEIVLEDAIRVTRGRLRKTRSTATTSASTAAPTR